MRQRDSRLDILRGITILSMVFYHALWDVNYMFGKPMDWYLGTAGYVWQQSICWTFILLSGYLAGRGLMRGLQVFGCGALITAVTLLVMPQERVVFGVLTLIGSCKLLVLLVGKLQKAVRGEQKEKILPLPELAVSFLAFMVFRHAADGWLGITSDPRLWFAESIPQGAQGLLIRLPGFLYRSNLTAYLGFPQPGFFSTDYFPLLPWFCLFLCGFFLRQLLSGRERAPEKQEKRQPACLPLRCLAWIGRHSLLIYMLHQPVIYGLLVLAFH